MSRRREDLSTGECAYIDAGAKRRNVVLSSMSAVGFIVVGTILYFAISARHEQQRADVARTRAEGLIDYMVIDLRDKLKPVGRLDLMAGINERVNAYYEQLGDAGSREAERRRALGPVNTISAPRR